MAHYFCIDVGGTRLKTALLDSTGRVLSRRVEPAPTGSLTDVLVEHLDHYRDSEGVKPVAAGVSIASVVDEGRTLTSTNLPYGDLAFEEIGRALQLPIAAGNDGHCMALGEAAYGAGRGCDHLVAVCLGTGVGGGVISGGRMLRGHRGAAAEVGHIHVDPVGGLLCGCGATGCLETVASARALERNYEGMTGAACSAEEVAGRARRGEPEALRAFADLGRWLGLGLGLLSTLFDPQRVVVSGGLVGARDLLQDEASAALEAGTYGRRFGAVPELVWSPHADAAGLWGALVLALDVAGHSAG